MAKIIQAFFDALTAKSLWRAKEQNEAIAGNTLEAAKSREAKGAGARSDTLQATTALAKVSLEKNRALGSYRKAMAVLVYALGVPTKTQITLADDLNEGNGATGNDLDAWLTDARKNHPAIVAARAQWESSQRKIASTRSEGLPTVDFSANFYQNGYPGQGVSSTHSQVTTAGISLSVPLFDGFARTYKIRGAQALAEQKEAELADTEHSILMEVVKAYADADSSVQNLQASELLLKAAQDSLTTSQRRYDKGAADILEILNTQAALADARQERIRCMAEWRGARLRLMANAGVLGRTTLVTP
jgi:outer membrane protein